MGGMVATIEPIVGIKFRMKVNTPQRMAKSTPVARRTIVTSIPVSKLIRLFRPKYCCTESFICCSDCNTGSDFLLPSRFTSLRVNNSRSARIKAMKIRTHIIFPRKEKNESLKLLIRLPNEN